MNRIALYKYPELWAGCVGAWTPSVDQRRGTGLLTDQSGRQNNAALVNMAPATDWVQSDGKIAISCDGVDGAVVASSVPMQTGQGSFGGWFYHRAVVSDKWMIGHFVSGGNRLYLQSDFLNRYSLGISTQYLVAGPTITAGRWRHIFGTYDATTCSLYVDGKLFGSAARPAGLTTISGTFSFGGLAAVGVGYAAIDFDDVRFYNRVITPSEILLLAQRRGVAYDLKANKVTRFGAGSAAAALTGTAAITEAPDTLAASGWQSAFGIAAIVEAADVGAASAKSTGWGVVPDTAEIWTAQTDTSEIWTPITTTPEGWTPQ